MISAKKLPVARPLDVDPIRVPDLAGAVRAIHPVGEQIATHATAMDPLLYTTSRQNDTGFHNHFQGFQRLSDGRHFVISGSNWHAPPRGSEIYIGRMGSRAAKGPWLSNLTGSGKPPAKDQIIAGITVDETLWHAGGMDVLGPILAVAIEHNDRAHAERLAIGGGRKGRPDESAICFFDVSDPAKLRLFKPRIVRKGFKAGAVALTRLANGHYLCGVWSDSDAGKKRLDMYLSESKKFDGRFRQKAAAVRTWVPDAPPAVPTLSFQAVNFVHDTAGGVYLLGFGLDGKTHQVELYSVEIPGSSMPPQAGEGISKKFQIRRLPRRSKLRCPTGHCDLRGASGAYVDGDLIFYSGAQYRGRKAGDPVRFSEFRRPLQALKKPTAKKSWVELYDKVGLDGARLTLKGLATRGAIADYRRVRVGGKHFGDRARSARYQVPVGFRYVLYRHANFKQPIITLRGTGRAEVEADFAALGGQVSSSRLERDV